MTTLNYEITCPVCDCEAKVVVPARPSPNNPLGRPYMFCSFCGKVWKGKFQDVDYLIDLYSSRMRAIQEQKRKWKRKSYGQAWRSQRFDRRKLKRVDLPSSSLPPPTLRQQVEQILAEFPDLRAEVEID